MARQSVKDNADKLWTDMGVHTLTIFAYSRNDGRLLVDL
jgi:hypothetical protein